MWLNLKAKTHQQKKNSQHFFKNSFVSTNLALYDLQFNMILIYLTLLLVSGLQFIIFWKNGVTMK